MNPLIYDLKRELRREAVLFKVIWKWRLQQKQTQIRKAGLTQNWFVPLSTPEGSLRTVAFSGHSARHARSCKKLRSPNLHWRVILRSQDGSCYKVKIIAVILGGYTQTSNSWYRQMWSTVNSMSGCADASPPQSSFSGPTWGGPPLSMRPWAHCHQGEVKALRSQHQAPPFSVSIAVPQELDFLRTTLLSCGKSFPRLDFMNAWELQ